MRGAAARITSQGSETTAGNGTGGGLFNPSPCGPFDPAAGPIVKSKSTRVNIPDQRDPDEIEDSGPRDLEEVEDTVPRNPMRIEDGEALRLGRTESNRTQRKKIRCHNEAGTVSDTNTRQISSGGDSVIQSYQVTNQSGEDTIRLRINMKVISTSKDYRVEAPDPGPETFINDEELFNEGPPNEEWPINESPEYTKSDSDRLLGRWFKECHGRGKGHLAIDSTLRKLFEIPEVQGYSLRGKVPKGLRIRFEELILACPTCQKLRVRKPRAQASHFTCSSYQPMKRIAIDYIEKLRPDDQGNNMIVVVIDCFSRFVALYPVKGTSARKFCSTLLTWSGTFWSPEEIITDRGTQFTSDLASELFEALGVNKRFTMAGSKQENSIVERANREVMRHLKAIIMDSRVIGEWGDYVPTVQRIMNNMVHGSTGLKPSKIIFAMEFSHELFKAKNTELEGTSEEEEEIEDESDDDEEDDEDDEDEEEYSDDDSFVTSGEEEDVPVDEDIPALVRCHSGDLNP